LSPIVDLERIPLQTLEEALCQVQSIVPHLDSFFFATENWLDNDAPQGIVTQTMTKDKSMALNLYTREWTKREDSLYYVLNQKLREPDRKSLQPFYPYLKLLLSALEVLPKYNARPTLWRGVQGNVSESYKVSSKKIWWGFASCTTDLETAKKFLGDGDKTVFNIHFDCGYDISHFSCFPNEFEILLPPARYFEVLNSSNFGNGLYVIELKEMKPKAPLISFNPTI